jgi:hypothetical protein
MADLVAIHGWIGSLISTVLRDWSVTGRAALKATHAFVLPRRPQVAGCAELPEMAITKGKLTLWSLFGGHCFQIGLAGGHRPDSESSCGPLFETPLEPEYAYNPCIGRHERPRHIHDSIKQMVFPAGMTSSKSRCIVSARGRGKIKPGRVTTTSEAKVRAAHA